MSLTPEQERFAEHPGEAFVEACPGAGKTRTILARLSCIAETLPPRRGVAVLSFTNKAIEEFEARSAALHLSPILKHPGFVGTFDSFVRQFLFMPASVAGLSDKPHVIESWDSLAVEVRLGRGKVFQGPGVSLDLFDPLTNAINPDRIGHAGLRAHVVEHRTSYENAARAYRANLTEKGYFSAGDARIVALQRMRKPQWGTALGKSLAGRFIEIIVDEAQDCNPHDLEILRWLRTSGVRVTVVCDMDQAIYGFRNGDRMHLERFADTYAPENRLPLTGNFRSSPVICALAATLRTKAQPDDSLGPTARITHPVALYPYAGKKVPSDIGQWFADYARGEPFKIPADQLMILSHGERSARIAAGGVATEGSGTSKVARLARAIGDFWHGTTRNGRSRSLQSIEALLLDLCGLREDKEPLTPAVERLGMDKRSLRRQALEVATRLPKHCPATDSDRAKWIDTARMILTEVCVPILANQSVRTLFKSPSRGTWSRCLEGPAMPCGVSCSTIHNAKGGEYPGVCVVIPPDDARNFTTQLTEAWVDRSDSESKRVVYVGVTRAMKLVALAIPVAFLSRYESILASGNVPFVVCTPDRRAQEDAATTGDGRRRSARKDQRAISEKGDHRDDRAGVNEKSP